MEPDDRHLLRIMVDGCAAPLVVIDGQGRVVRANQACADLLSTSMDGLVGRAVWDVFPLVAGAEYTREQWLGFTQGGAAELAGEQLSIDDIGNRRRVSWTYRAVTDPTDFQCVVGTGVDVTRERLAEAHWRQKAQTDPLTGLANRVAFEDAITAYVDLRTGLGCGVLFCDLDGFKQVNDTHGHATGDELLVQTAKRIASAVRQGDLVARLGGDEFAVLLPAVGLIEMRALAARLEKIVRRPVKLAAGVVSVGVSVGLAVANPGDDPADTVRAADTAMYAVKARRAGRRPLSVA